MGFRIDGCGTYSANNKLKYIGDYMCDTCKTVHPFYLYELIEKISVLYIPVAKISTRYAALCEKCKIGYKVTEEQKLRVMSGDTGALSQFFAVSEQKDKKSVPQIEQHEALSAPAKTVRIVPSDSGCCPRCGTPIDEASSFCSKCGRKYTVSEKHAIVQTESCVCDNCGSVIPSGVLFCTQCGNQLNK